MPTAIVTGATGITGHAVVQHLIESPEWTKIITLSRSQQPTPHDKVTHATLDLQSSAQSMTDSLKDVRADYVFFCAYLARDDEGEAVKVNGAMLSNFIEALHHTGAIKQLKRIILVNGLKQYGVHLGQPKEPMHETDPWLEGDPWPPNFYYAQQRILADAAKKDGGSWSWVVTYPQDVIGVAKGNFMNLATSLGLYAAVSSALPGRELVFPGSLTNYMAFNCWTSATLHAKFCLWAALEPKTGNNAFNVINGDTESWQNLWPRLAERFGAKVPQDMFPDGDEGQYKNFEKSHTELPTPPPIVVHADKIGLKHHFENKHSVVHQQIDTAKWAKRPEVVKKWEEIRDRFGLDQEAWDKATWAFLTFLLGRNYSCVASMSMARKLGWTGYQDTWDAFDETFAALEDEGILPKASELKKYHSG
ncbi:hypothetical protein ABEF92_002298 [Exophiala dermatitidis]|uniref:PRISE-like Rossmann-fold domain-containing protein n=1 Tax=Exophiala dermatitidis (strain ATCC 34100 / CBS 525.76 / NIH/UT8656) TaxID=858893 RepID=H6CBG6_EXODN|nr:uncharacterized protein HMPREF1120_09050 [Exophiala dermatitidis NIH/UT8656]EHY61113.1 hypothetical protein HMPREF1120_09050 [Exophiala dermatitidis NIH/UT8656]